MSEHVRLEVEAGIGTIRLDRAPMNALDAAMQDQIGAAAAEADARAEIRAVIVYGGDRVFAAGADIKAMQAEIMDLKITNKVKDQVIEHLKKEYDKFSDERQGYIDKLIGASRRIGEMTARLLQLEGPEKPRLDNQTSSERRDEE